MAFTPPPADLTSALVALLPVLVGGFVAVVGAATGPIVANIFEAKSKRRQERLARFEEMATNFYSYELWMEARRLQYQFGEANVSIVRPLSRAATLAALHFPSLEDGIDKLRRLEKHYTLWMTNAGNLRIAGKMDEVNNGLTQAYQPWFTQFVEVEKQVFQLGRTLLKASAVP